MNLILALSLLLNPMHAMASAETIVFHPYKKGKSTGTFLIDKDQEDLRVLDRRTNRIAYWYVKKNNLVVEQFFSKEKLTEIRISKTVLNINKTIIYKIDGAKLKLSKAIKRRPLVLAGEIVRVQQDANICTTRDSLLSEYKTISNSLSTKTCADNLEQRIIDPKCKSIFSEAEYNSLKSAYVNLLSVPQDSNPILECMKSDDTQSIMAKGFGLKDQNSVKTQFDIIDMTYQLNASKFYTIPEAMEKKVTCAYAEANSPAAMTVEGTTTYFKKKDSPPISETEFQNLVSHELVHGAGVKDECVTKGIVGICFENASAVSNEKCAVKSNLTNKSAAQTRQDNSAGAAPLLAEVEQSRADTVATSKPVITQQDISQNLPQTLAANDFGTPPAAQLAQPVFDSPRAETSSGGVAPSFVSQIKNQGFKVLERAEGLLKSTDLAPSLAYAGPVGTARGPASSAPTRSGETESLKALRTVASAPGTKAEKYEANLPSVGKPGEVPVPGSNESSEVPTAKSVKSANQGDVGNEGARGSSGSGSSLAKGSINSSGGQASGSGAAARAKASSNGSSEVQKILANFEDPNLYEQTKSRIESGSFQRKLKENGITVLGGNEPVGASRGSFIYFDNGTRFVRQETPLVRKK